MPCSGFSVLIIPRYSDKEIKLSIHFKFQILLPNLAFCLNKLPVAIPIMKSD